MERWDDETQARYAANTREALPMESDAFTHGYRFIIAEDNKHEGGVTCAFVIGAVDSVLNRSVLTPDGARRHNDEARGMLHAFRTLTDELHAEAVQATDGYRADYRDKETAQ